MDFSLTDEQNELAKTLHAVLARHADPQAVRGAADSQLGYDPQLWQVLAEDIGVASLAVPEEFGGAGCGWLETGLVLETLGYHLAPAPLLSSAVLATAAILESGNTEACERLLPGIAEGETLATLAWADPNGNWDPASNGITATRQGDGWALYGEATLVIDGMGANLVLAVAQTESGTGIFEILDPEAIRRIATPAVDTTLRFASFAFDQVPARALAPDAEAALSKVRDIALVSLSCWQAGTARRSLDMTVEYSKQREQFGRAIGSFQALKHRMADMLVQVETSRTAAWAAAWSAGNDAEDLPQRAASAAAWCSDALDHVAAECVQLHGGIAITWEHDAQLVFKRAHATGQLFGPARAHRQRLGDLLGLSVA
ncbi:acyl-CoA dehydrogenase family protein [Glutamicibacter sp.]|uniref:acyl-CoA dehydrogenase family protein n=1 Tax=Glutamicibacter sp. TaxID=1931995 RepID=UPI003D6BF683